MKRNEHVLYVTSFSLEKCRRPVFASQALRTLGFTTRILQGWEVVEKCNLNWMINAADFLPKPLDWLARDITHEIALFTSIMKHE